MGEHSVLRHRARRTSLLAAGLSAALLFGAAGALAQSAAPPAGAPAAPPENKNFIQSLFQWFGEQASNFNSNLKNAGTQMQNFGREAGIAAKSTTNAAREAADAVAKFPKARVIPVHEKCEVAPNGAPDCVAVAMNTCKAKGFESGKSVDMTTAEVCPPKVLLSGRSSGPECHDETFVSRVLCQ
jgi:hypothetical protein